MSLLADAECPKVAFENVELKENNENGKVKEIGKEKPGDKCKRLICDNKVVVALICVAILGIVIGIVLGFLAGKAEKGERIIRDIPTDYRLPETILPKHYVLEVQPYMNPKNFTFDGKVEISVVCAQETDKVILHSNSLTIQEENIRVRNMYDNTNVKVSEVEYNETMSFLILHLEENMMEGKEYLIFLSFNGKLQRSGKGFYVSSYYDDDQNVHYTASTQYEAIHAREGFPCFDEPLFKATFEVTIVRWRNMSSLSNMPRVKTEPRGKDWVADSFLSSLKMSTYLVAYFVGEYVGRIDKKIRVWAPKHQENQVDYSLDVGNKVLSFLEDSLRVPYPAPKLDMIPVTELVAAAMENWGLIIYLGDQLLYDEGNPSAETRQIITTTVAHEIAHQWFGNLVTPKWWTEIWVSEGMTTYMENYASMNLFPEWNEIDKTIKTLYDSVYEKDCYDDFGRTVWKNLTAQQITLPAQTFGTLVYMKGAMIGRMMHYILGNETFWRGISAYLKEYSYGNVEEKDMWRHLTEAQFGKDKIDMAKVMWGWTHVSGSPIVTVKRDYSSRTATVIQHSCKVRNVEKFAGDLWQVPISYSTPKDLDWNPKIKAWLTEREITLKDMPKQDEWILVNGNSVGYYLVNYDDRNWELLAEQLRKDHKVFSVDQRYKILADANILYKFDKISIVVLLDLSTYLKNEEVLSIYEYPNGLFLNEVKRHMEYSAYDDLWKNYTTAIFAPILEKLGWEDDRENNLMLIRRLRGEATRLLCEVDYPPCVEEAVRRFNIYRVKGGNQTVVTRFNRDYLFCTAVRSGPWEVAGYFLTSKESDYLSYLACSKNASIVEGYLFDLFKGEWNRTFYSASANLMKNRAYWRRFLNFLDGLFKWNDKNVFQWFSAVRGSIRSLKQKDKVSEIFIKHVDTLEDESERKMIERFLMKTEEEMEERQVIEKIGSWMKRRLWAD